MSKRILFLVAAIALAAAGFYFRSSNAHSAKTQADSLAGADLTAASPAALASLKTFVGSHTGASVSVTLKGSYARAQAAAAAAAAAQALAAAANSQIYADAQRTCSGKSDSITQARCNQAYLSAHLASIPAAPPAVPTPKLADYQYNLKAPIWTPDLAGALLLGAAIALGFSLPIGRRRHHR